MRMIHTVVFFSFLVALSFLSAVMAVSAINFGSLFVAIPAIFCSAGFLVLSIIVVDSDLI
jgi:hypothetical protein